MMIEDFIHENFSDYSPLDMDQMNVNCSGTGRRTKPIRVMNKALETAYLN